MAYMRSVLTAKRYRRDVLRLYKKHYDVQVLTDATKILQRDSDSFYLGRSTVARTSGREVTPASALRTPSCAIVR